MSTTTTAPVLLYPAGTNVLIPVVSVTDFPKYTYVLATDGVYTIFGHVIAVNSLTLGVKISTIQPSVSGGTLQSGATVTFAGPAGPVSATSIGYNGTVLFKDLLLSPSTCYFNSGSSIANVAVLGTLTFTLPSTLTTGIAPNYRVVVEFNAAMVINASLTNSGGFIGIGTTNIPLIGTGTQIYGGYTPIAPGPSLMGVNCVADTEMVVGCPASNGLPGRAIYVGTFQSNAQLSFTALAAALQTSTVFYVGGDLIATAYPLY